MDSGIARARLRAAGFACFVAIPLVGLACLGCDGADGGTAGRPPGTSPDASADGAADTGTMTPDTGPTLGDDDGLPLLPGAADRDGFEPSGETDASFDDSTPLSCYDGLDNDDDGVRDCRVAGCRALRPCCAGDGDCCAPALEPTLPTTVSFAGCEGTDPVTCLDGAGVTVTAFGDPSPFVFGDALAPGGDGTADSGLVFAGAVDLVSERFEIDVDFLAAEGCGSGCLEGAGVSLTADVPTGDDARVRAAVGLLASGSRGDVALVLGDVVVGRWAMVDAMEAWRLVLRPDGRLSVLRGEGLVHEARYLPIEDAHVVLHGHSRNPGPTTPPGVGIGDLRFTQSLCDMSDGWRDRAQLELRSGSAGVVTPVGTSAPTLAYDGSGTATFAFEVDGAVFLGARPGADRGELTTPSSLATPSIVGAQPHDTNGVGDPELVWDPSAAAWVLYYTATSMDGTRSIGRATFATLTGPVTVDAAPLLSPGGAVQHLDQPTVAQHPDGTWVMVARAIVDGASELRAYVSHDTGLSFEPLATANLRAAFEPGGAQAGRRFDEVAEPSLLVHGTTWYLYASRRTGARWSTGVSASHELVYWRTLLEGDASLGPSGQGFDRLGTRGADVAAAGDALEMVYIGLDGTRGALGITHRRAAPDARFLE